MTNEEQYIKLSKRYEELKELYIKDTQYLELALKLSGKKDELMDKAANMIKRYGIIKAIQEINSSDKISVEVEGKCQYMNQDV